MMLKIKFSDVVKKGVRGGLKGGMQNEVMYIRDREGLRRVQSERVP